MWVDVGGGWMCSENERAYRHHVEEWLDLAHVVSVVPRWFVVVQSHLVRRERWCR